MSVRSNCSFLQSRATAAGNPRDGSFMVLVGRYTLDCQLECEALGPPLIASFVLAQLCLPTTKFYYVSGAEVTSQMLPGETFRQISRLETSCVNSGIIICPVGELR